MALLRHRRLQKDKKNIIYGKIRFFLHAIHTGKNIIQIFSLRSISRVRQFEVDIAICESIMREYRLYYRDYYSNIAGFHTFLNYFNYIQLFINDWSLFKYTYTLLIHYGSLDANRYFYAF